jgi:hypothetical protein
MISKNVDLKRSERFVLFPLSLIYIGEPGSSVRIVSGCGLADRGSILDRGRGFFLCVRTGSGTMGTEGSFPRGKARPGRDADHSPPSSAEVKED